MSKNVLVLYPRLDCTFKPGPFTSEEGPIPPIREHWKRFIEGVIEYHEVVKNDRVVVQKAPLWMFEPGLIDKFKPDITYIPHKQFFQFPASVGSARYYMQTVFPHLFSVDNRGWGANASFYPFVSEKHTSRPYCDQLARRALRGESKFPQPADKNVPYSQGSYILFVCQIPHDEVIIHHSDVKVDQALEAVLGWARLNKKFVVVKSHPINPGSMIALHQVQERYTDCSVWVDNMDINALVHKAEAVFTVNSGVGYETLIHGTPLFCFGRVEYDCVASKVKGANYEDVEAAWRLDQKRFTCTKDRGDAYWDFLETFAARLIDTTDPKDFDKLG